MSSLPHIPSRPRGADDANSTPLGREPPRGPKALVDTHPPPPSRGGGSMFPPAAPRGRGYPIRGDFRPRGRDRDLLDSRDEAPPPFRRDIDRDWPPPRRDCAFDSRDTRPPPPPPFGRGRSRSPPPVRDFRESRDIARDAESIRIRRNSRDNGPMALGTMLPDFPPHRGSYRGRGRGDRGRGRGGSFADERARRRSRSREPWRERAFFREDRDRDRAIDRGIDRWTRFGRREDDKRVDRESRSDRFSDRFEWKRERNLPPRIEPKFGKAGSSASTSPTTLTPTIAEKVGQEQGDAGHNGAAATPLPPKARDVRKEPERPQIPVQQRPDIRPAPSQPRGQGSPRPAAPEVPAFGSVASPQPARESSVPPTPSKTAPPAVTSPKTVPISSLAKAPQLPLHPPSKLDFQRRVSLPPNHTFPPPTAPRASRNEPRSPSATPAHLPEAPEERQSDTLSSPTRPASSPSMPNVSTSASQFESLPIRAAHAEPLSPQVTSLTSSIMRAANAHTGPPQPTSPTTVAPGGPIRSPQGLQKSPRASYSSVPTGPRALQRSGPVRPPAKGNNQWVRPGYVNSKAGHQISHSVASSTFSVPPSKLDFEDRVSFARPRPEPGPGPGPEPEPKLEFEPQFGRPIEIEPERESEHEPKLEPEEVAVPERALEAKREERFVGKELSLQEEVKLSVVGGEATEKAADFSVVTKESSISQDHIGKDATVTEGNEALEVKESSKSEVKVSETAEEVEPEVTKAVEEGALEDKTDAEPTFEVSPETEYQPADSLTSALDTSFGAIRSPDEESDSENALDEEDFKQREEKYEREMKALDSDRPPPILENKEIVNLLTKIQMLRVLAAKPAPATSEQLPEGMEVDKLEPTRATEDISPGLAKEAGEAQLLVSAVLAAQAEETDSAAASPTPKLPFLQTTPQDSLSELDVYRHNEELHEHMKDALQSELSKRRYETWKVHERLRKEYAVIYKRWRLHAMELDQKKRREKLRAASSTASPPGTSESATLEGRRGYKLNSELDFQNALKASELSAQQEELERQRERAETEWPDLSKEAVIPDMLDPAEREATIFKDTNQSIDVNDALDVFAFYPEPDDFTPEEHKAFMEAFMQNPKKWGRIAESLPGRDFQQCIKHYYMTKLDVKYKAKLNKRVYRRRGRGRQSKPPKSVALMADLGIRPDLEKAEREAPQVTDTGRPRRAAAPTFGETPETTEVGTPASNSGRKGASKETPEQSTEKPRRGRGGGRGKRTRGAQATLTAPSLPAVQSTTAKSATQTPAPEVPSKQKDDNETQVGTPVIAQPPPRSRSSKSRAKTEGMSVFDSSEVDSALKRSAPYGSFNPTSYWSVPEVRDFPALVAHFGRDFEGISDFMKTKTATMCKNYYQRQMDTGKTELEEIANRAAEQKARGEPTAPLPVPSAPTKRRYDSTPSSAARPIRPTADLVEAVEVSMAMNAEHQAQAQAQVQAQVQAQIQAQAHSQAALESRLLQERSVSSRVHTNPPAPMQPPVDDISALRPAHPSSLPRGPRMGYFSEDRRSVRPQVPQVPTIPPPVPQEPVTVNSQPDVIGMQNVARMGSFPTPLSRPTSVPQPLELQEMRFSQQVPRSHVATSQSSSYLASRPSSPSPVSVQNQRFGSTMALPPNRPPESCGTIATSGNLSSASFMGVGRRSSLSSSKDLSWSVPPTSSRQLMENRPAPPRQVPAKRSNIVNILNDEPEEPQPRKRFAADAMRSSLTVGSGAYHPLTRSPQTSANDEIPRQQGSYGQGVAPAQSSARPSPMHTPVHVPIRPFTDPPTFSSISSAAMGPTNQDWMIRFDPRNQHMGQGLSMADHHISRLSKQPQTVDFAGQISQANATMSRRHQSPHPHPHYVDNYQQQPLSQSYITHTMQPSWSNPTRDQAAHRSPVSMGSPTVANAYQSRMDSPSHLPYTRVSLTRPPSPMQLPMAGITHRKRHSPTPQPPSYLLSSHPSSFVPHPLDKPQAFSPRSQRAIPSSSPLHTPKLPEHAQLAPQPKRESGGSLLGHSSTPSPSHIPLSRSASVLQASGGLGPLGLGRSFTPPAVLNPSSGSGGLLYSNLGLTQQRGGPVLHPMHPPMPSGTPPPSSDRHRAYGHDR
ncbi:hypothetical protein KEM54_005722 [Ascosphaera aggregata]|nr:hypothetical protein KEM54_005722 [Ascosphaera aggregata]